jgi:predicted DNA-binding helix-hairpin-helix protein
MLSIDQKIDLLMEHAMDDHDGVPRRGSGDTNVLPPRLRHTRDVGALRPLNIRHVRDGRGRPATLLRILMTNACSFNCHYCPMRRDRELPRTLLKPEELVRIFLGARARGWCDGLFITTGIPGRPVKVLDDLIQVLELLRERHRFGGYIHVKIVPGGEAAQVARLTELATRVSINLETPCGATLSQIAPEKHLSTTLVSLEHARQQVAGAQAEERAGRPRDALHPSGVAGMTVQFVVGATPDTDRTILTTLTNLYRRGGVHHAQFSAFRPIRDTPLENAAAAPAIREFRLYQADHLMRNYGFAVDELSFAERGDLVLDLDPKVAWALAHPERFPVDVTTASPEVLLRVPGVGPASARRIVAARRTAVLRDLRDLRELGVITARAGGFVTLNGRLLQSARWTQQLGFWDGNPDIGVPQRVYDVSPGTFR